MTFKAFNIDITISLFFSLILVSAIVAGFYIELLAALSALLIHEIAHIFLARMLGLKVEKLELLPFGGRIKMNLDETMPESEMITVLAGPMANFIMAGLLFFLVVEDFINLDLAQILIKYQLSLGLFNMLPALPLDGGRIFVLWLRQFMNYLSAVRLATKIGKTLAVIIFLFTVLGFAFGKLYINFLVISILLFLQAHKETKDAPLVFMAHLSKKKEYLSRKGYMSVETLVVVESTSVKTIIYLFTPQKYFLVKVLNHDMHIIKCLTETEIFNKIVEKGLDIRITELL